MSTKALRTIGAHYQQITGPGRIPRPIPMESALDELEAIERAAKEWVETDGQPGPGRMQRLDALMRSIAKETT